MAYWNWRLHLKATEEEFAYFVDDRSSKNVKIFNKTLPTKTTRILFAIQIIVARIAYIIHCCLTPSSDYIVRNKLAYCGKLSSRLSV